MAKNNQAVRTASPLKDWQSCFTQTLHNLFKRLDEIEAQCPGSFPLYSVGNTNQWLTSSGGSWIGGFWAGCWWLRAFITKNEADLNHAQSISQRLALKLEMDSIHRSLIFWYGLSPAVDFFQDAEAENLLQQAAEVVANSYKPNLGCIPLGSALGGGEKGQTRLNIDSLAAVIALLTHSENSAHHDIARLHLDTIMKVCGTENGAFYADAEFADGTFHPEGIAGDWSRGQAWAMLGLVQAAKHWGEPYLTQAQQACDYWLNSRSQLFPPQQLSRAEEVCDPSAMLIACVALLSLAYITANPSYRTYAEQQISILLHSQYVTEQGLFWGCCIKTSQEQNALVETAWGYFFLIFVLTQV